MKSVNAFGDRLKTAGKPGTTGIGSRIYRFTDGGGERYLIDFADQFTREGWMQFDTDQDASYFGVWVNPSRLSTLTFCEGDWALIESDNEELYNAEIEHMCQFYGEGFVAKSLGQDGTVTVYQQDRGAFFAVEGGAA
jgi:hypothetical protein